MFEDEYEFTEEELASPRPYTTEQLAERAAANSELAEMLAYINGDVAAAGDSGDGTDPLFDDEYEDSEYEKYVSDEQPRPYTAEECAELDALYAQMAANLAMINSN